MNTEWLHKDMWKRHGRNFLVEVSRHTVEGRDEYGEGPNRWAVYAYIYPKHPHFANFTDENMWQEACACMPGHSYPSYFQRHESDGRVTSMQVGWDYHHLHDDFTHIATKDGAYVVFRDAENLFQWLTERAEVVEDAA